MNLNDLLKKPVTELTDEELIARINLLKSARLTRPKKSAKPNSIHRIEDLISKADNSALEKIKSIIQEVSDENS